MPTADLFISMARRYYRSKRTVVVRPKKKWASNFRSGTLTTGTATSTEELVTNSVQANLPTPVVLKAGNFKIQGDMSIAFASGGTVPVVVGITAVVFFLPEGITLDGTSAGFVMANHPEWIIAWKQLDGSHTTSTSGTTTGSTPFSFSSRLKRNLNSGDRICIGYKLDSSNANATPTIRYTCQFWTCSN